MPIGGEVCASIGASVGAAVKTSVGGSVGASDCVSLGWGRGALAGLGLCLGLRCNGFVPMGVGKSLRVGGFAGL